MKLLCLTFLLLSSSACGVLPILAVYDLLAPDEGPTCLTSDPQTLEDAAKGFACSPQDTWLADVLDSLSPKGPA
jgi:hypothetical protein